MNTERQGDGATPLGAHARTEARARRGRRSCFERGNLRERVSEEGAVMVEALLVIPLMLTVLAGTMFFHDVAITKLRSAAHARACAWAYAGNGCSAVPTVCSDGAFDEHQGDSPANLSGSGESSWAAALEASLGGGDPLKSAVFETLKPALDLLLGGGGFSVDTASSDVRAPIDFDRAVVRVSGHYELRCNLRSTEPLDLLTRVWEGTLSAVSQ